MPDGGRREKEKRFMTAVIMGGCCVLVSALFGSVMPKEVEKGDGDEKREIGVGMELKFGEDKPKPSESPTRPAGEAAWNA